MPLISAIGVSLVLQDLSRLFMTSVPTSEPLGFNARYQAPDYGPPIRLFEMPVGERTIPVVLSPKDLIFIIVAVLMLIALNYLVNATRLGKAIRATAQDMPTASLMGINVNQVIAATFFVGGALAGAAGTVWGLYINSGRFLMGFEAGLMAFTSAVLGGIGNIRGAVVGSFVIGMIRAMSDLYLSAEWTRVIIFGMLILILVFRPAGILGSTQATEKV